ncbi:TetR/AcrR family transcriptional regulator [Sphingomonas sp. NSE70-1]|uniref:TetR/AcrR family transcriptional regulator n=1 Tax=Sphingomonas caseinilyticus TaxID=2908205 RepID=A0ABT0RXL4_9SPHN|nr:TetR/AcrR family transcriptional regulator [Sphingomonas caseinilyticus]
MTRRIHEAILELLVEGGIDACTFQNIASRAGVERSTLYRRNPDRWPTIIDAIIDFAERETAPHDTGTFRGDLTATLRNLARALNGPLGPALITVAAALQTGVAPGQGERFWASRMERLGPMFDGAIARGELRDNVDREAIFSMAAGPIYFRRLIAAKPVGDDWVRLVVDEICGRYCLEN